MFLLKDLRTQVAKYYDEYMAGKLNIEEYIQKIKPLDQEIDRLELQTIIDCKFMNNSVDAEFILQL